MKKFISIALALMMALTMFTGCNGQSDVYRIIKVNSFEGTVTIQREDKMDAFEGLQLISKDTVEVGAASLLELLADSDKHIVAEENTAFKLHSTGTEKSGNITIDLMYGSSLITIDNKLPDGSEFVVNTPNASLSVRGTTFEVSYDQETESTIVEVIEGVVVVDSKNGTEELTAGATTIITNDEINGDEETQEPAEENGDGATKPLTFEYSDNTSFNIRYKGSLEKYSGIKAKALTDWQAVITHGGDRFDNAIPATIEIYYWGLTKDQLDQDKTEKQTNGYIENSYTLKNDDGQMIDCIKCNFHNKNFAMEIGQNNVEFAYQYYKKITDDMYLSIMVCDIDGGKALANTDINSCLQLTEDRFFVYDENITGGNGGNANEPQPIEPLNIEYKDTTRFEVRFRSNKKPSGILVKELGGWSRIPNAVSEPDGFTKNGVVINYWALTEAEVEQEKAERESKGYLDSSIKQTNNNGQTIVCLKYNFNGANGINGIAYQYYKEVSDNVYLSIMVYDRVQGGPLEDTHLITYSSLTYDHYYVFTTSDEPAMDESTTN